MLKSFVLNVGLLSRVVSGLVEKLGRTCRHYMTSAALLLSGGWRDGLLSDVYAIFNHHKVSKEIWDRVKLLMQGTKLSLQEKDCNLYDEFDKFTFVKGETLKCTQPKRPWNAAWFKEKEMLAEAQEAGQILDEEQLAFLADLGIPDGQAV
ncbi:hypothetical protein Tco_1219909 [Tanacetum coccineum]